MFVLSGVDLVSVWIAFVDIHDKNTRGMEKNEISIQSCAMHCLLFVTAFMSGKAV